MPKTKRQAATALDEMRTICVGLPDMTEGAHFGKTAFKVGAKMFATCGEEDSQWQVIIGATPARAKELLAIGDPFSPGGTDARLVQTSPRP
jgi:hypothetical protein